MLPATTTLERDDIGAADRDPLMIAMKRLIDPVGAAKDDYDIFAGIAQQLGKLDAFHDIFGHPKHDYTVSLLNSIPSGASGTSIPPVVRSARQKEYTA